MFLSRGRLLGRLAALLKVHMKVTSGGSASTLQVTLVTCPRAAPTTPGARAQRGESRAREESMNIRNESRCVNGEE